MGSGNSYKNPISTAFTEPFSKSQVAIEYCYRYRDSKADSHVLWVYGGTIARFYQGYKRIAQQLDIPGWDDPEASILELVRSWLSDTRVSYLMVVDNADDIEHWWPGKYKSVSALDDPSSNLSKFLPDRSDNGKLLITTRDQRVAARLAKEGKPVALQSMSYEEAKSLFLASLDAEHQTFDEAEIRGLLEELDYLPLAVSQAAAFVQENGISISEYTEALRGKDASMADEYLNEELDDSRRDEESVNSVFRAWKVSYDRIKQQKPRAADLLCLLAMLDRQSVPRFLLAKVPEVTTSLGVLQAFHLITARAGSQSYQLHRLVQRFAQLAVQRDGATQKWQEMALSCVSKDYPTEIGVAEWAVCDSLAPHVHVLLNYKYTSPEAQLDLAHLLCWAADFDIERGMYTQALARAERSLSLFRGLVSKGDQRLASAIWLYGRLRYYEAQSASDMHAAANLLEEALSMSDYKSLNYAESAFELAHLYYDQGDGEKCLQMGKASFECWEHMEGPNSSRTLDNMHDYALELAMLGREEEAITAWQDIIARCPTTDASENTKAVYSYRSMAGIAEFQDDAAMAQIFYTKLISLCRTLYHSEHVHVYDYRLSFAEQIMLQGKLEEAIQLSEVMSVDCNNKSEWRIQASCLQTIAACYHMNSHYSEELSYRLRILNLHQKHLGDDHKETSDAKFALADCYLSSSNFSEAQKMYQTFISWSTNRLGSTHADTLRAIECIGVCYARQDQHAEAEAVYIELLGRLEHTDARLLDNLQISLWKQGKWQELVSRATQSCELEDGFYRSRAYWNLISALEHLGQTEEALQKRTAALSVQEPEGGIPEGPFSPSTPPMQHHRRFGRIVHPRTWSA